MFRASFVCLMLAVCLVFSLTGTALAAQVDSGTTYCFSAEDFLREEPLEGICVTAVPDPDTGTVLLGSRVIRSGDILTAWQLEELTFQPLKTQEDKEAVIRYLPIYEDRVAPNATTTLSIHGKRDDAPVAEDSALETYKNMENTGKLKARDPEGQSLTYAVTRQPKRGTVELREDGSFTYTPKKNKVGVDSFTYTAADPAGNLSRTATVTIQILKPTDARQYTDTAGTDCQFAAEWLRTTGLFEGEKIGGERCFYPEKDVTRGEFLAMVVKALDIPTQEASADTMPQDTPGWLRPYLAAAIRSGLTAGWPDTKSGSFEADQAISGAEAAVMLQNALDLTISQETLEALETATEENTEDVPVWAAVSLRAMADNGIALGATETVSRGEIAQVMYQVSQLALDAPGAALLRMQ